MNIGERISKLRQENNLNKEELANKIGYSKSIITYWENNERTPNAQALVSLASCFNVTIDYLLMTDNRNQFADKLKEARKTKGYTQKEVATKLQVVESAYANWEQGRAEPSINAIKQLTQILDITPNYLFGLEDYSVVPMTSNNLSDDQQYILSQYNKLSSTEKQKLANYITVCTTK